MFQTRLSSPMKSIHPVEARLVGVGGDHALPLDVFARFQRQAGAEDLPAPMGVVVHPGQPKIRPAGVWVENAEAEFREAI